MVLSIVRINPQGSFEMALRLTELSFANENASQIDMEGSVRSLIVTVTSGARAAVVLAPPATSGPSARPFVFQIPSGGNC